MEEERQRVEEGIGWFDPVPGPMVVIAGRRETPKRLVPRANKTEKESRRDLLAKASELVGSLTGGA